MLIFVKLNHQPIECLDYAVLTPLVERVAKDFNIHSLHGMGKVVRDRHAADVCKLFEIRPNGAEVKILLLCHLSSVFCAIAPNHMAAKPTGKDKA